MFNKSIALSVLLAVCSASAIAAQDTAAKLNTIKAMYQHHKSDLDTLPHYVNASLKKAFRQQDRIQGKKGEICGPDYDVMWQAQDTNYHDKVQFSALPNGQIQVKVNKQTVRYVLSCTGNRCQVTDIFDSSGSIRNNIYKECR